ncbi:uncharacterized protein LOC111392198 [Olea europaea var. sylvestris]|uniref:uncharacterized protein LOC111392198 n=1 Tax=Olea europaea var. sylvestris TaxID=158386 RepID=UPI000C1D043C|nr:uncharacterized protein LOC111392198 [Olea europaea var. sylvestris]
MPKSKESINQDVGSRVESSSETEKPLPPSSNVGLVQTAGMPGDGWSGSYASSVTVGNMIKAKAIKPFLLKDYLLDDFSSCSSNGFKSFPRRQCCATVRFLIDIDKKNIPPPPLLKTPSKSASSTALNSAFQCVINALKHLPFAPSAAAKSLTAILKRSFWKRTSSHKEIEGWKSLDHLVKKKPGQFSSTSESNDSKSKTTSLSDSDITASDDSLQFSIEVRNNDVAEKKVVAVTNDAVSMDSTTSSEASASTNSNQTKITLYVDY